MNKGLVKGEENFFLSDQPECYVSRPRDWRSKRERIEQGPKGIIIILIIIIFPSYVG